MNANTLDPVPTRAEKKVLSVLGLAVGLLLRHYSGVMPGDAARMCIHSSYQVPLVGPFTEAGIGVHYQLVVYIRSASHVPWSASHVPWGDGPCGCLLLVIIDGNTAVSYSWAMYLGHFFTTRVCGEGGCIWRSVTADWQNWVLKPQRVTCIRHKEPPVGLRTSVT